MAATDPLMQAIETFKKAGIYATLGLAMRLAHPGRWSWRRPVGERKAGHTMKLKVRSRRSYDGRSRRHKALCHSMAKVSRRKYGRWIRQGLIPKHL